MKILKNSFALHLLLFCSILIFSAPGLTEEDQDILLQLSGVEPSAQVELVWVEHTGDRYNLYSSEYDNGEWGPKQLILTSDLLIVTPCLADNGKDGKILVWSEKSEKSTDLYFSLNQGDGWSSPQKIETNLSSNLSPALAVDKDNQLWMAWVGSNGEDDDIYFSRWDGASWDLPARVHIDNATPDLFPVLGIGPKGMPWIQWSGYENGKYNQFRCYWNGLSWDEKKEMSDKAVILDGFALEPAESTRASASSSAAREGGNSEPVIVLPDFLKEPDRAAVQILGSKKEIQTFALRDFFGK